MSVMGLKKQVALGSQRTSLLDQLCGLIDIRVYCGRVVTGDRDSVGSLVRRALVGAFDVTYLSISCFARSKALSRRSLSVSSSSSGKVGRKASTKEDRASSMRCDCSLDIVG